MVIHQLPRTPETLWLRLLGKGRVQKRAIDEIEALPADNPFRENALLLLSDLRSNLEGSPNIDEEERELIMRLSPRFTQQLEEATQQGVQQGLQRGIQEGMRTERRVLIENLLRFRFGSLDEQLEAIIQPVLELPTEEFYQLVLQPNLSREELLARFAAPNQ